MDVIDVSGGTDGDSKMRWPVVWGLAAGSTRGAHHSGCHCAAEVSLGGADQETTSGPAHRTEDQTIQVTSPVSSAILQDLLSY